MGGRWRRSSSVVVVVGGDVLAMLVMRSHALSSRGAVTLSIAYVKLTCNGYVM